VKKFYIVVLFFVFSSSVFSDETGLEDGDISFGAGLGIPYGVLGANMNYKINSTFDVTAGLGLGYGAGVRVHPLGSKPNFRITAFYGTNVILAVKKSTGDEELERYQGFNLGIGYGKLSDGWDVDLVYAFAPQSAKDREKELESQGYRNTGDKVENRVTLSFGYHW